MTVLLLELNEINFLHVRHYVREGKLPTLGRLIEAHGVVETTSESRYQDLEPWIQWVTAHTGKTLAEHGVFRLGDIVHHDLVQIWEALEDQGLKVGAISPMNATNRCRDAEFFMPDPWASTPVTGSFLMKQVYGAVAQAVNDNAHARMAPASAAWLLAGLVAYARPRNYTRYLSLLLSAVGKKSWSKALLLDLLLADLFIGLNRRKSPHFATLFLNAGAHIQHHYMFNSSAYDGERSNPDWYLPASADPILDVYQAYDRIVGQIREAFPQARLMLATGLHQDPHPDTTFYWRLKHHDRFLRAADVPFRKVEPLMSRDFLVSCVDADQAATAEARLAGITSLDGRPLFVVDNRGADLFVMLTWDQDIGPDLEYRVGNSVRPNLRDEVAFVAIKNGQHNGVGYLMDTGVVATSEPRTIALRELPGLVANACGVSWPHPAEAQARGAI